MNALQGLLDRRSTATRRDVAALLEPLAPRERARLCRTLRAAHLRRLFDLAGDGPPCSREDFFPTGQPSGVPVHLDGWNSLPLPRPIRRFAKPVCDLPGTDALGGFNEGLTRPLLGPGYFILRRSDPAYLDRGAWVVDYLQVPDGALVAGWPRVVPTSTGWRPHRLVYGGTRDYMRRVCEGVTVGLPWKGEARLAFPFTLVRVPLAQLPGPR